MRITAQLQEMAESEILAMVPTGVLAELRTKDPHPLIKAFVVGHEGESKGNLVGLGNVVKRWFKAAVRALGEKIQIGLQLFHGHVPGTNAHEGRTPVGQVVGSKVRDIEGRESVIVACHIFPAYRGLQVDIASVEMDVEFEPRGDGSLDICGIGNVTGIALGNSLIDKPGFAGATLLGQLQAFEAEEAVRLGYTLKD